jgi:hypothetical protein
MVALREEIAGYFHHLATEAHPSIPVSPPVQQYLDELERQQGIALEAVIPYFVQRLSTESNLCKQGVSRSALPVY